MNQRLQSLPFTKGLLLLGLLSMIPLGWSSAQNSAVRWSAFDQGFGMPGSLRVKVLSIAGQSFVGFASSGNVDHEAGFLADTLLRGPRRPSRPIASFRKTFGGGASDVGYSLVETADSGFLAVGQARSFAAFNEAYIVKTAPNGSMEWQRTFHRADQPAGLLSVDRTRDGGYVASGWTTFIPGTITTASFLAKLNANGDTLWTRTFGSPTISQPEAANAVRQTSDGGYILVGAGSTPCPVCGHAILVMKTDSSGDTIWTRTFAGSAGTSVQQTADGGYIILGWSGGSFIRNLQLIKLDSAGATSWAKSIGGLYEYSFSGAVRQTIDGGYILSGDYAPQGGSLQAYLVKTDSAGSPLWSKKFFAPGYHSASSVIQALDGGYMLAGVTGPNANAQDGFLLKTDSNGDSLWVATYGGAGTDRAWDVIQTDDGGFAFVGQTASSGSGLEDLWLVKGDDLGVVTGAGTPARSPLPAGYVLGQNFPNPFNPTTRIDYELPVRSSVSLGIYNMLGQKVATLVDAVEDAGFKSVTWNAAGVSSGVYFYRFVAGTFSNVKRLLLIK